jgi:hypothetical protein
MNIRSILHVLALSLCLASATAHAVTCAPNMTASNPDIDYNDNGDGTVTHLPTGLVWKRCIEGTNWNGSICTYKSSDDILVSQEETLDKASASAFAGKADWRVPNIKELRSLVEECRQNPAINEKIFPETCSVDDRGTISCSKDGYWHSPLWSSSFPWKVYFEEGISSEDRCITCPVSKKEGVRLVRGGKSFSSFDALANGGVPVAAPVCSVVASPTFITAGGGSKLTASCRPAATSYVWTGGSCAGITTATCTVTPSVNTTYTVAGINSLGAGPTTSATVAVVELPICTLTATPASITAGATSTLSASCTNSPTSFAWYGGTCTGTTAATCTVAPSSTDYYFVYGVNAGGTGERSNMASVTIVASCTFGLGANTASHTASGGVGGVVVISACDWTATSNASWLTVNSGATGNGTVAAYSVAANTSTTSRTGTLTIAGKTFTVTQAGALLAAPVCNLSISPSTITAGASSTLTASCPGATSYTWTGGSCAGTTAATCTVAPSVSTTYTVAGVNSGGTGPIVGATVTVSACTYVLGTSGASHPASGGVSTVSVSSGCNWTATSNASWISVTSGTTSAGNGTVAYSVAANTSTTSRTGTLTVAGQTFRVTQAAANVAAPVCTLSVSPSAITAGASSTLTATCSGSPTSYQWNTPECSGSICTVKPTVTTTYLLTGINASGPGTPASAAVTVTAVPVVPQCVLAATPPVISLGSGTIVVATCVPAATSYIWFNNGIETSFRGLTDSPSRTTMYTVVGVNAAGRSTPATAAVYVCDTQPAENYTGLTLSGTSANEQFRSGIASDTIDGGPGFDSVIYQCNRDAFTVTKTTNGWTVSSKAEGIDTLSNVERIKFGNETLALDISGVAGQAYRIYQAAFNRVPDNGGLKYWISQMDAGMSQLEVAARFVDSDEFRALYGINPTNAEFLTRLYSNVLHRAPDTGGYAWWLVELDAGRYNKVTALAGFSESPENQAGVLNAIINGIDLLN